MEYRKALEEVVESLGYEIQNEKVYQGHDDLGGKSDLVEITTEDGAVTLSPIYIKNWKPVQNAERRRRTKIFNVINDEISKLLNKDKPIVSIEKPLFLKPKKKKSRSKDKS